jgi:membrane protease YdiL (CAAX protease family)
MTSDENSMIICRKERPSQRSQSEMQRSWRCGGGREVVFWLLLLGSWQFLTASGSRNGIIGAVGTVVFLFFAAANLDRLEGLGLEHARWRSVAGRTWGFAVTSGFIAGLMVFWIATASGEGMKLSDDRKLVLLQVTLGPILEEIVFRGYLFALVLWGLTRIRRTRWDRCVVAISAVLFAAVHLARPGVSWVQAACITCTGAIYGLVRYASGSAAPAAASHAAYNLTLYAVSSVLKLLGEGWQ